MNAKGGVFNFISSFGGDFLKKRDSWVNHG